MSYRRTSTSVTTVCFLSYTGNFGDCHLGSDRQHLQYHLSSKAELASSSIPLQVLTILLWALSSPWWQLVCYVACNPVAAMGSRYSCSAVHYHIHRYCYLSAYASHTSFFCAFCNLIGGTQKSDPVQNRIAVIPDLFLTWCCTIEGKGLPRQTNLAYAFLQHSKIAAHDCLTVKKVI